MWTRLTCRSDRHHTPARGTRVRLAAEPLEGRDVPGFLAPVASPGGGDGVAVADFNHDGRDDVVVISGNTTDAVSLSTGDGTFRTPISLRGAVGSLLSVTVSDLNGDGHIDVSGNAYSRKYVRTCNVSMGWCTLTGTAYRSVWLGNGDGTFGPVSVTSAPHSIREGWYGATWPSTVYNPTGTSADFNHDGIDDVATLDQANGTIGVSLRAADGSSQLVLTYPAGSSPRSIVRGDFNGDGWADLVVVNSNKLSVWRNDGSW